jgi:hypothetical protein
VSRKLIITGAAAVLLLGATPALALEGVTDRAGSAVERVQEDTKKVTNEVRNTVESTVQSTDDTLTSQKERIEARKTELKQRLEAKATERKERLEGRRLAQCQNRQTNINELMDKSANVGREKLARIQGFEQAIKDFYVKQELTTAAYDDVVASVDAAEGEAIAALDAMDSWQYDCEAIDGQRPTEQIQLNREAKREGLKAYRDSVQELLKVVREAFVAKQQEAENAQQ